MTTISIRVSPSTRPGSTRSDRPVSMVSSLWTWIARNVRSTWCVINGGHYKVLHTEPDRMALRCVACGHMSPGWDVSAPGLARTRPADPERVHVCRRQSVA